MCVPSDNGLEVSSRRGDNGTPTARVISLRIEQRVASGREARILSELGSPWPRKLRGATVDPCTFLFTGKALMMPFKKPTLRRYPAHS
jgi:hypothetical protein